MQQWNGTQWVSLDGSGNASLLELGLLGGDLNATAHLDAGEYRAFVTFNGAAGLGLLGGLDVTGVDSDYTHIGSIVPEAADGNVITDPGPGGEVDIVSPDTVVQSVTIDGVTTAVTADGTVVDGDYGTLVIDRDGSYVYTPDADTAAIGHSDTFTYTLIDPSDGELESATLTVTVGSDDVTGAPVAVDDQAGVTATYDDVTQTIAPVSEFSFTTPGTLAVPVTRSGSGSFTIDGNTSGDVTITAIRGGTLALLPTYTITVTDSAGHVVQTVTQTAVAGLPLGSGVSMTVDDLGPGQYSYTVSSTNIVGTGYGTTVYLGETLTHLDQHDLASATSADGNVLDNDSAHTDFVTLRIDTGAGFTTIGDSPTTVEGQYGTLTIDEHGTYHYEVNPDLAYSSGAVTDSFEYQIVQPGGQSVTATLDVTIDSTTPESGVSAAAMTSIISDEPAIHSIEDLQPHDTDNSSLSFAYQMFEGQGELEQVLTRYLGAAEDEPASKLASAESTALELVDQPSVADPLGYLADSTVDNDPDLHHHI